MQQSEIIFLVEESPEGGYEAQALGEAIFTQAATPWKNYAPWCEMLCAVTSKKGNTHELFGYTSGSCNSTCKRFFLM